MTTEPGGQPADDPADESPMDFLQRVILVGEPPGEPPREVADPFIGTIVGGITIEALIGEGGMGRVYRGTQERPRRTVAVKVMRPGLLSSEATRRFEREAEVLGGLQHPGIATVHAAGVHDFGLFRIPFIVIEHIPAAEPLTDYADAQKLGVRERLQLFHAVCEAVAHGHERNVVHRDLKPSNILVDVQGKPKVIDYGIALAAGPEFVTTTIQAASGQLLGTLQYMSPEQFTSGPDQVTARSDVYSLGVVLYELLTGKTPHQLADKPIHEIARLITQEPPRPIRRLDKRLPLDIAAVAATCVDQEPRRRYATAGELAADVAQHLRGEPVLARPRSLAETICITVRRHRREILPTALAVVAIAAVGAAFLNSSRPTQPVALAYLADLRRVDGLRSQRNMDQAGRLLQETKALVESPETRLEIRCLEAELDEASAVLRGHAGPVNDVAYAPDGSRVASAGGDGTIRVWSIAQAGDPLVLRGHTGSVRAVSFNAAGSRLVSGSNDGTARIWSLDSADPPAVLSGHTGPVTGCGFDPGGGGAITVSADRTIRRWDPDTGAETQRVGVVGASPAFQHARFSSDTEFVVTASESFQDPTPRVWNTTTGRLVAALKGHGQRVWDMAFSPDGGRLATVSDDRTVRIWDTTAWQMIDTLIGHDAWVTAVTYAPDGNRLATASGDKTVRVWDLETKAAILTMVGHTGPPNALAFDPGGRFVVTGGLDATVRCWDVAAAPALPFVAPHAAPIWGVAISPDGTRIATGAEGGTARIIDAATFEVLKVWEPHTPNRSTCSGVAFDPSGRLLATCCWNGAAAIWDVEDPARLPAGPRQRLTGHTQHVWSVAFSPDGRQVATASGDRTARVWDAATGKTVTVLQGHGDGVRDVAFSPDGRRIATSSWDTTARVWDADSGRELFALRKHTALVRSVVFSPDGRFLLTAADDRTAILWDAGTGAAIRMFLGHESHVWDATFTPDGRRIVTGAEDHTARIWDVETGDELLVLSGHKQPITRLRIGPEGTWFVTGSHDRTARLWGISAADIYANRNGASHQK